MITAEQNIESRWFRASEATGDFMGISYGRVPPGSNAEVEWLFVSHCECDGIGGFARILREQGADIPDLPMTTKHCKGVFGPLWRLWREKRSQGESANRWDWHSTRSSRTGSTGPLAWHLFSEQETKDIVRKCRRDQVTVNSLLLAHLDKAIRPEILRPDLKIPWMIPVNMRGAVQRINDTDNHVSCVEVSISPLDSAQEIQNQITRRLERGEHRANYILLGLGKFLSHRAKVKFLKKDRSKANGNIGAFSNLGIWDKEKSIATDDSWLFCPPVVTGQLLGAGCVTFQNRLSLTIQVHPNLSSSPDIAEGWMRRWVKGIHSS